MDYYSKDCLKLGSIYSFRERIHSNIVPSFFMRYIIILYLFGAINISIFTYMFSKILNTLTKNVSRIVLFCEQR